MSRLKDILKHCVLCPRRCLVDRTAGEKGFCQLDDRITMACALLHHGEEPPISGENGAGTLFLSSCNLRCPYCQNHQISHRVGGKQLMPEDLSEMMLALQEKGAHNIEAVTPTPQLPQLMEALGQARRNSLRIPFVYNCGGYENPEVIRMLDGWVNIYLPDFKYGDDEEGWRLSRIKDYSRVALASIKEMMRQVGDDLEQEEGIARKGIIIRHLVLPGRVENSLEVLRLISRHLSLAVPLSIMSQYTPTENVMHDPLLGRRITGQEYGQVLNSALEMGFETLFIQDVDDRSLSPDFDRPHPFVWDADPLHTPFRPRADATQTGDRQSEDSRSL